MSAKRAIFEARRDRLLQIESKVRSWWKERNFSMAHQHMKILTLISTEPYWPWGFRYRFNSKISFPSPGEAIKMYSADATLLAIGSHSADSLAAQNVKRTLYSAVTLLAREIEWMEEFLTKDQASLRTGSLSTFSDRAFENQINVAVKIKQTYRRKPKPRASPEPCFRFLQNARDLYSFSCGSGAGGMNRDLLLHYMDIQTILISAFCPHYSDYVWKEVLKKDGLYYEHQPTVPSADFNLFEANMYLHKVIRMINEEKTIIEDQKKAISSCLIYVREHEHEQGQELIKRHCLNEYCTISDMEALHMVSSPSQEREVIEENLDLIKRLCGLQDVQVLSTIELDGLAKAGPLISPSPGHPAVIFLTK